MIETLVLPLLCSALYLLFLAYLSERTERSERLKSWAKHPLTFGLALGVYATSWSFYGSVGLAASYGYVFLAVSVGVALSCLAIPVLWAPLADVVRRHRLTNIADLLAYRYQSNLAGALVTLCMLAGLLPYLALQLRSITSTAALLAGPGQSLGLELTYALMLLLFAAGIGVRYVDPRQQRPGLLIALAVESLAKVCVLLLAGCTAMVWTFGGWQGLQSHLTRHPQLLKQMVTPIESGFWAALTLVSFFAAFLLPRQFHVAFVERPSWKALRHTAWTLPLFLLLLNLPLPILYWAGKLQAPRGTSADVFVLYANSSPAMKLLTFLGGVSASSAMVLMSTIALCGMVTHHLVLPLSGKRRLAFSSVLQIRRLVIAGLVVAGFLLHLFLPKGQHIVDLGLVSFVAVLQLVPGVAGVLFWPRATRVGLLWGISCGMGVWCLMAALPLLGLTGPSTLPGWLGWHSDNPRSAAIWISLTGNSLGFVLGSLFSRHHPAETIAAATCAPTGAAVTHQPPSSVRALREKLSLILGADDATKEIQMGLEELHISDKERRPLALGLLAETVERNLSEWMGPMAARRAVAQHGFTSPLVASLQFIQQEPSPAQAPKERSFQAVQQYLFEVLRELPLGVCAIESEGNVVVWNRALSTISGIDADEVIAAHIDHIPDPWGLLLTEVLAQAPDDDVLERVLTVAPGANKQLRMLRALVAKEGAVVLFEDLTEQRQMELQLRHQARLASVGRLAAGVAHEIGNPLTGILMLAQNMQREIDDPDLKERLGLITQESHRIEEIIRTMLQFSRRREWEELSPEVVDIEPLFKQAVRLASLGKRSQHIQWRYELEEGETPLQVWGHPQRLMQVLLNLLSNACDATEEGGEIILRGYSQPESTPTPLTVIEIEDRGCGIPENLKEKIFEPFFTTKDVGQGTGLGLAIAYWLVQQHNGLLQWRPAEPCGTIFCVHLPARANADPSNPEDQP